MDEVLRALDDPTVREVYLVCGSQMGKTETALNFIGKRMDWGPRYPTLVIQPTAKLTRSFMSDRMRKMLKSAPSLWKKLEKGVRDTMTEKFIAGVALRAGWAGSATELSSHPCGIVLVDERDRCPDDVDGQGDPIIQAKARMQTYHRGTLFCPSTPTIEDASPIQNLFDQSTREFFEWNCPHCQEWFRPQLKLLKWPKNATPDAAEAQALLHCPECGAGIENNQKTLLNRNGRYHPYDRTQDGDYVPVERAVFGPTRSFWVSGLCSPWSPHGRIARELVIAYASRSPEVIQSVINTYGGEVFRTRGDAPDWHAVSRLSLPTPPGVLHPHAKLITVGADVQQDSIYYVIRAWGFNMTSWLLRHGIVHGQTEYDDVWVTFDSVLAESFNGLPIRRAFVDSGYKPGSDIYRRPDHQVYLYCRRHMGVVYPTKGRDVLERPIIASHVDVTHGGATIKNGLQFWNLDTDYLKTWIYSRIRWPDDAESGHWHLHGQVDEDYCRQVVAEEVVTKASGKRVWLARRSRPNHYLDAEVNALAAALSLHAQAIPEMTETPNQPPPPRPQSSFPTLR